MTEPMMTDDYLRLLERTIEIVSLPETRYGYSDVGDILVSYLRGRKTFDEAMESLGHMEEDYAKERLKW